MRIFGKLTNRYCTYFFTSFICKIRFQDNSSYDNGVSCVIYKRHISVGYSTSMRRTSIEIPGFKSVAVYRLLGLCATGYSNLPANWRSICMFAPRHKISHCPVPEITICTISELMGLPTYNKTLCQSSQ